MTGSASGFIRMAVAAFVLLAGSGVGGGAAALGQPHTGDDIRADRARNRLLENRPATDRAAEAPRQLPPVDPALVEFYRNTVTELADPAYEGRAPGGEGIARAAEFIEAEFRALGLQPAFATTELAADGTEVLTPRSSFRQGFGVGERTQAGVATMSIDAEPLEHGVDFSVLAYSGDGEVSAPLSFAGYAIVSGPGGYLGFDATTRFEGRTVLCLAL
jgi:hypothetical protein